MSRKTLTTAFCLAAATLVTVVSGAMIIRQYPSRSAGRVDPRRFTSRVDNSFFPLRPGTRWVYRVVGPDAGATRAVVQATPETRKVGGVDCVAVRGTVTADQQVVVDTISWYAQDAHGNVWLFGEENRRFQHGRVASTAGSWKAGVHRAEPHLVMKADPKLGDAYRPAYGDDRAADSAHLAQVVSLDQKVSVPFGFFTGVLVIKDPARLRPGVVEHRFYARGVGLLLAVTVAGPPGHTELVAMTDAEGHTPAPKGTPERSVR